MLLMLCVCHIYVRTFATLHSVSIRSRVPSSCPVAVPMEHGALCVCVLSVPGNHVQPKQLHENRLGRRPCRGTPDQSPDSRCGPCLARMDQRVASCPQSTAPSRRYTQISRSLQVWTRGPHVTMSRRSRLPPTWEPLGCIPGRGGIIDHTTLLRIHLDAPLLSSSSMLAERVDGELHSLRAHARAPERVSALSRKMLRAAPPSLGCRARWLALLMSRIARAAVGARATRRDRRLEMALVWVPRSTPACTTVCVRQDRIAGRAANGAVVVTTSAPGTFVEGEDASTRP